MDNDPEIKDKYQRFKMEKAVYVGESARSIFERAQEHRKDAVDAKGEKREEKRKTPISTNTGGFHIQNSMNHQPSRSR